MLDPKERFSSRVSDYVKYRPHYPEALIDILRRECGLTPEWQIADIGCGTGISSELFLQNGNIVFGIEPNKEMREAAELYLKEYPNFIAIDASAAETMLASSSVDMVIAGQAFHWFDHPAAKMEFRRILKTDGWVALFWNKRRSDGSPFTMAYEAVLQRSSFGYNDATHRKITDEQIAEFYAPGEMRKQISEYYQHFDIEGLIGRTLSCSYAPQSGDPLFEPMIAELNDLFAEYQQDGMVTFEYDTEIYIGKIQ
ncbi:MAG: class I SAM-dependent methyltransferase [Armatimonadota bacterium]